MYKHHSGEQYNWLDRILFFDIETEPNRDMLTAHMPEELRAYVISDVARTRALAIRMHGHYWV